jgi:hypothetical protein
MPNSDSDGAREDRELFSNQTLILTALTAINNPNMHPLLNAKQVNDTRLQYMKDKGTRHTPVIDAATTILITDTEILATMAHGIQDKHSILALREVKEEYKDQLDALLQSDNESNGSRLLDGIEKILPADFDVESHRDEPGSDFDVESHKDEPVSNKGVFISFPNIDKGLHFKNCTEGLPIDSPPMCNPIHTGNERWTKIMTSKSGFIFEPPDYK